jgi:hypothetical protein
MDIDKIEALDQFYAEFDVMNSERNIVFSEK